MPTLTVDGRVYTYDAEPDTPLLWVLREHLGLTGTKSGCAMATCGTCTVHVDGVPTRSCVRHVSTIGPRQKIVTIEGRSTTSGHPSQGPGSNSACRDANLVDRACS